MIDKIRTKYTELFKTQPLMIKAPGRINLIGEHTDYNDGFVLPAAIDNEAVFAIQTNGLNKFRFYAYDLDQHYETDQIKPAPPEFHWANYLLGVLAQFKKQGVAIKGINCVFGSNIPIGAGLSSSAALECGFALGLNKLFQSQFSEFQLVKMAQKAEHEYAGVMCGIMDQFTSVFGKKDHVFRLDCRTYEHTYYPSVLKDQLVALVDTGVKHELASSEYNKRRRECDEGVAILQKFDKTIKTLRDATVQFIESHKDDLGQVLYNRCHYVSSENERVLEACIALSENDFEKMGELMYQSHEGLQRKYEVSCKELDFLVDMTRNMDFVYGARMMGGGFGGCTINIIKREQKEQFHQLISEEYHNKTGITPNIYYVKISDGVTILN